jgi:hypothetical protein
LLGSCVGFSLGLAVGRTEAVADGRSVDEAVVVGSCVGSCDGRGLRDGRSERDGMALRLTLTLGARLAAASRSLSRVSWEHAVAPIATNRRRVRRGDRKRRARPRPDARAALWPSALKPSRAP